MNNKVKEAIDGLLDMFRSGDIPEKIALVTNPDFNVPSSKWSLNNRLIQLFHGTMDSRGIRQWGTAGRKIRKGSRAIHILAPSEFSFYKCICSKTLFSKDLNKDRCPGCDEPIDESRIQSGIAFNCVPVFRVEDTEGSPLPYENIPLPQHRFLGVAKSWNLEVKSSAFLGNAYGYYKRGEKIVLASPEELVFYHELAHAAHERLGLMREKRQDPSNEIVAEFAATSLAYMEGKTTKLGNSYDYLEHYAKEKHLSLEKAVLMLLSEIEKVIQLILGSEKSLEPGTMAEVPAEVVSHGMV
ncbi:MAG: hypothetical protein V1859_02375 [archaeon]